MPPQTRVVASRWTIVFLATLAAAGAFAENNETAPGATAPMAISFFIDRRLPAELRVSLDAALRKLSDSRCQEVLTDFSDVEGRRLDANLAAIGHSPPSYLGLVLFYDGRATQNCASRDVLAWTNPGSRAVQICWNQFAAQQRFDMGYTANIIIHEALHTLGLREGPLNNREITAQVVARCGR
jgi:hypothetical protein